MIISDSQFIPTYYQYCCNRWIFLVVSGTVLKCVFHMRWSWHFCSKVDR